MSVSGLDTRKERIMGKIRAGLKFNIGKHGRVYVPVTGSGGGKKNSGKGCSWSIIKWPLLVILVIAIFAPKSKKDEPEPSPEPTAVLRTMEDTSEAETEPIREPTLTPDPALSSRADAEAADPVSDPEELTESTQTPTPDATPVPTPEPSPEPTKDPNVHTYILNTGTKKFHYPSCSSVKDIKDKNKQQVECTREELIAQGYDPCGRCHP